MYTSASWYSAESILFNSWSPRKMWGATMVKHFYICFNGENLWKMSSRNHWATKSSNLPARWSNGNKKVTFHVFICEILANITHVSDVTHGPLVNRKNQNCLRPGLQWPWRYYRRGLDWKRLGNWLKKWCIHTRNMQNLKSK
jgi:hypothetical protein